MTPKEFFFAVVEMRKHQRAFERSNRRDIQEQRYAKDLENKIDKEIVRVQQINWEAKSPRLDL